MYINLKQYIKDHENQLDPTTKIFFGDVNALNFLNLCRRLKNENIDDSTSPLSNAGAERLHAHLTHNLDVMQYRNRNIIHNHLLLKDESHGQSTVQLAVLDNREVYYPQILEEVFQKEIRITDDPELESIHFYLEPQSSLDAFQLYYQDIKTDNGIIPLIAEFLNNHLEELDTELRIYLDCYCQAMRRVIDQCSMKIEGDLQEIEKEQMKLKEIIKNKY